MDMSRPAATLVPSLDAEVLSVLAGTSRPLTGREIGRLVRRGSVSGVQKVLSRLADHGLVSVQEAGPALLYVLNRDHLVAPLVEGLASLRAELFARIKQQLGHWQVRPVSAVVFGSAARGDGDLHSDVDVLLVRPDDVDADHAEWQEQVAELSAAVTRWTGNAASIIDVSAEDVRAMSERREPIVGDLMRDSVRMAGGSIADLLSGQVR